MILYAGGVGAVEAVLIPFGVFSFFAIAGDGVDTPVDEDPEFRVLVPLGNGSFVKGFPGGLPGLGMERGGEEA